MGAGTREQARKTSGRISRLTLRTQPDGRLVALVREGHDAAFEEIVRRYRAPLVRFAGSIVPADLAEDAVQEALLRAHNALRKGEAEIALRAWLYTIVRNGAVSERRRIRPTEQLDESINGVPQPPDIFERREQVRGVVARLKKLPPAQREAIVRTELGGASAEEIAAGLSTSPAGVGQLVFRARSALRSGAALILPMPLLRVLVESGGGSATAGGVTAGVLAGGGGAGGAALKVGVAVVVAVVAVGPARGPITGGDGKKDRVAIESGDGGDADAPSVEAPKTAAEDSASASTEGSATGGGGSNDGSADVLRRDGGTQGGGGASGGDGSYAYGGEVSSELVADSPDGHDEGGSGGGGKPQSPPPPNDGGDDDGGHDSGTPPPPPPDDGGDQVYGGDGHHTYDDDGGYGGGEDGGGGDGYGGGGHDGHH